MEWDILMAITAEDMTSNTLQQRMIPKKTQTKTQVEFQPFPSDFEGGLRFVHRGGRGRGLCRKRRPWSKFFIIEDLVVSYTSKVEIPVSR